MINSIDCKLGNMAKVANWVIYPIDPAAMTVTIQCNRRIARVDLGTGKALLSSGKGGHQGFVMLNPALGARIVDVPADVLVRLREFVPQKKVEQVSITGA